MPSEIRNRLATITGTPGSIGNESFACDPLDNVRRVIAGGADRRFHHDAATLRLTQTTTINSPATTDYSWNTRGELTARTRTGPSTPPVTADTIFLDGFDASLLSTTETFGFDQARRLTGFPGGVTHTYDAHNHRVSTTTPAWGTRYQVYSRSGELLYIEDSGANQRTEFFHLNGTLVAERTRPLSTETIEVSYLHSDHRGTPTVKTDSSSNVHYRSRLMPYGAPYDGIYREGPGFTKHATDDIVQLSYMQQRYYDPDTMRFLSPDPIAAGAASFNVYAYANNNPYTFVDPDGRATKCIDKQCTTTADSFNPSRSNGQTTTASKAVRKKVEETKHKAKSENRRERTYFVRSDSNGNLSTTTPSNADVDVRETRTASTAATDVPPDSVALVHGHIEKGRFKADGMVDVPAETGGYGDTLSLALQNPIPTATVFEGNVGWHEIVAGQLQFTYPQSALTPGQVNRMQHNLNIEQGKFHR